MTQPEPEVGRRVDRLDGNAAGGPLSEIFGADLTDAIVECRNCAQSSAMAETVVELDPDGLVMRCRGCRHQLLSYVWLGETRTLRFSGLVGLVIRTDS
jgi:hypothetical protein